MSQRGSYSGRRLAGVTVIAPSAEPTILWAASSEELKVWTMTSA